MSLRSRHRLLTLLLAIVGVCTVARAQNLNTRDLLIKGDTVPPLRGFGIDGNTVTVNYSSQLKPTVVYVVQVANGAARGFGKVNEANFAALVQQAGARFHFVLVVPEDDGGLVNYVATARAGWGTTPVTVVANVPDDVRQAYTMFAYPQTLVISHEGKVLESFQGAYTASSRNAQPEVIQRYFGITLTVAKGH
jgi:hypothetical protein